MRLPRTSLVAVLFLSAACSSARDGSATASSDVTGGTTLLPAVNAAIASGPSYGLQVSPVVVAGTNQYLTAWTERHFSSNAVSVSIARLGADGALLDDQSLAIASGVDPGSVALAFDGTGYLAVWTARSGGGGVVLGTRIAADGHVLDATPFKLGRGSDGVSAPSVAYGDGGYLVTWQDDRDKGVTADAYVSEVYGARISSAGAVVGPSEGFRITNAAGSIEARPAVAAIGDTFLVAYGKKVGDRTSAHAVRVSNAGVVVDTTPLAFGDDTRESKSPSVATDGSQFFVAWLDFAGGPKTVLGTRVAKDGTKIDATPIAIADASPVAPAVAWDGDAFSVAWAHGAQRVGANGQKIGALLPGGHGSIADTCPSVAGSGGSILVLHTETAPEVGAPTFWASATLFAKSDGKAIKSDLAIARGASTQRGVVTAAHGSAALAVWLDYRTDWSHPAVYAAGFTSGGAVTAPVELDPGTTAKNAAPAIVFDGSGYAVAWEALDGTNASTIVVHVNDQGAIWGTPKTFAGGAPQLAIGSNDRVVLTTDGLHGYFLDSLTPAFTRGGDGAGVTIGTVSAPIWQGNRIVLAWSQLKGDATAEIYTQRFDGSGGAEQPVKIASFDITNEMLPIVATATGRDHALLVWEDHGAIKGGRIGANGLVDAAPVRLDPAAAGSMAYAPRVAWDGAQWLLAYEARADKSQTLGGNPLALARVRSGANGVVPDTAAQPLSARGIRPYLFGGTSGNTFVGFESLGTGVLDAPRATFTYFTDPSAINTGSSSSSSSSSGGTTAGGDDDDGRPATPIGDDDDAPAPKKPAAPAGPAAKGATIKGGPSAGGGASKDDGGGGCAMSAPATGSSSLLLVAFAALVSGGLARRRSRVPHARR